MRGPPLPPLPQCRIIEIFSTSRRRGNKSSLEISYENKMRKRKKNGPITYSTCSVKLHYRTCCKRPYWERCREDARLPQSWWQGRPPGGVTEAGFTSGRNLDGSPVSDVLRKESALPFPRPFAPSSVPRSLGGRHTGGRGPRWPAVGGLPELYSQPPSQAARGAWRGGVHMSIYRSPRAEVGLEG